MRRARGRSGSRASRSARCARKRAPPPRRFSREARRKATRSQIHYNAQLAEVLLKISDFGTSEDIDVIFLPTSTTDFDLSPYVYEYVVLTIPMMKIYDCEDEAPQPCDEAMLDKLDEAESLPEPEEEEVNPIWEELKKKLTNNK